MRIYYDKYLSVTSLIELKDPFNRVAFENWCQRVGKDPQVITNTSRILGSKVSEYLDNVYRRLEWLSAPQMDKLEDNLSMGMNKFLEDWELVNTEQEVICEELNYAGRYDGLVRNKATGEEMLADWKTFGAYDEKPYKRNNQKIKHTKWQLTLYANATDWKGKLAVIIFKNDGDYVIEEVEFDKKIMDWVKENQDLILRTISNENTKNQSPKEDYS
ncbi:MAG: hypothetical protein UT94_C0024G0006 [Candidatus Uhrbacteria bacterium GW2011_GWF2_40_263]|nr:MAG: hypothetical protein UT94_C0024G0006 [Candidatus Uhrbacteria bacterium GW2011_GWF2_40_263]